MLMLGTITMMSATMVSEVLFDDELAFTVMCSVSGQVGKLSNRAGLGQVLSGR